MTTTEIIIDGTALTVILERIVALKHVWHGRVLVRIEAKCHRPVQRCPVPGWYQAAIPAAERRVYQVLCVHLLNLRVQVHVLVNTSIHDKNKRDLQS